MAIYKGSTKISGVEIVDNIDDTAASTEKTYSSSKIEEKLTSNIKVDYYSGVSVTETTIAAGATTWIDTGLDYDDGNSFSSYAPVLFRYANNAICLNYAVRDGTLQFLLYNPFSSAITISQIWFYVFSGLKPASNTLVKHDSI